MGDPVSAQVIFYKNGTIKFQYKAEEDGLDLTSNFSIIGLQRNSSEGIAISPYLSLDYGKGLAYVIVPANKYVIAPGESLDGNIILDAANIYGGTYSSALKLATNVPNQESLQKPVELTVTGNAVFGAPTAFDFGTKMIAFDEGMPVSHTKDMFITNGGSASLEISWISMGTGSQGLSLQVWALVDGWFGPEWKWADISELYSPWAWSTPVFTIQPGDYLKARAVFAPELAGAITDDVVFTTNIGEQRMALSGTAINPPSMDVDTTPISETMNLTNEVANHSISISNANGQSNLSYQVSIDYGRVLTARAELYGVAASPTLPTWSTNAVSNLRAQTLASYNRTLKHTEATTPNTHVGIGGSLAFSVATKFNGGPQGFTLSHIENWFRSETLTEGDVLVEIRAGGSIESAPVVGKGKLSIVNSGEDTSGSWHTFTLDEPAGIYPNEDFFVIITYPLGVEYPQGTIMNDLASEGTYYYFSEGSWYDLQAISSFANAGWLVYAAEEVQGNTSWLTVTSANTGNLAPGESGTIDFMIESVHAKRGDHKANIVITSNDPEHPSAAIPVTLHVNLAPVFANTPAFEVYEGQEKTIEIQVTDTEGDAFTVQAAAAYPGLTHTFGNGVLRVTLAPNFGTAGTYDYQFVAIDEYGAESKFNLRTEILHSNRAPEFVSTVTSLKFRIGAGTTEYQISDFFSDPDGDSFTFAVTSSLSGVVEVLSSESKFSLKPVASGDAILAFNVTDIHGATLTTQLAVQVGDNQAPNSISATNTLSFRAGTGVFEYAIADYFSDPEADAFSIVANSNTPEVAAVFISGSKFFVKPLAAGSGTLEFRLTDALGATRMVPFITEVVANQAPIFIADHTAFTMEAGTPTGQYLISNYFSDPEKDNFTFTVLSTASDKAEVFASNDSFFVKPVEAGQAIIKFTVTDAFGAVTIAELTVTVTQPLVNASPLFIGTSNTLEVTAKSGLIEYQIADFFRDPEGDSFTFSVTSSDETITEVLASSSKFYLKPLEAGTTFINFKLTDNRGASLEHEMAVKVGLIMELEDSKEASFNLLTYPNPTTGLVTLQLPGNEMQHYQIRIVNSVGVALYEANGTDRLVGLDLSHFPKGVYMLEVADKKSKVVQRIIVN
jgi:hypothetical protein